MIPVRNLTGGQLQTLMDALLYSALRPIVENTDAFQPQLEYVLTLLVMNKKRRPCACDPDHAMHYLIKALSCDPQERLQYIRKLKLERNFVYGFIRNFLAYYHADFLAHYTQMLQNLGDRKEKVRERHKRILDGMCNDVACGSRAQMYHTLLRAAHMLPKFFTVFNAIVENFMGFCAQQAASYCAKNQGHQYDMSDVRQNFMRAVIVGMNKYDCARGAHTGYIKWWLMHAQTCGASGHEYGLAFTVPQSQKKRIARQEAGGVSNFSISLDTPTNEDDEVSLHDKLGGHSQDLEAEINNSKQLHRLAQIAKALDPYGIARLQLDMVEPFSEAEITAMNEHTVKGV